jgi:hypothetical protein
MNTFSCVTGVRWFYQPGVLQPRIRIKKAEASDGNWGIFRGYHSYTSKACADASNDSDGEYKEIVRSFIIPKGTRYYHNANTEEYVSETIIMK